MQKCTKPKLRGITSLTNIVGIPSKVTAAFCAIFPLCFDVHPPWLNKQSQGGKKQGITQEDNHCGFYRPSFTLVTGKRAEIVNLQCVLQGSHGGNYDFFLNCCPLTGLILLSNVCSSSSDSSLGWTDRLLPLFGAGMYSVLQEKSNLYS